MGNGVFVAGARLEAGDVMEPIGIASKGCAVNVAYLAQRELTGKTASISAVLRCPWAAPRV
jgi:hypothetical protein